MESYEAIRAVFSRVQSIDPENASKIIGYILLHHGEKDMIRFAYGPETLIVSIVNRAISEIGISSNTSSALPQQQQQQPSSIPIPISRPNPLSIPLSSPRLPNNGFNPSSPSSPWSHHHNHHHSPHPLSLSPNAASNHSSLSYAAVVNGTNANPSFPSPSLDSASGFNAVNGNCSRDAFFDDYPNQNPLSFLNDPLSSDLAMSPGCRSDSMLYPYWGGAGAENSNNNNNNNTSNNNSSSSSSEPKNQFHHRRSVSFNDMYYGTDDSTSGFGFKPCLYYAKGFCKNGSTCKFVHGGGFNLSDSTDNCANIVASPLEQCQDEIFRSKFAHQQRLAAHLMSGGLNLPYNKLNFLQTDAQRSAAAALMMGEEFHKLNRARMARNEFAGMDSNPGSRQIYLTFPADSTFKEEDVSSYFNLYGPVQDVRIPYQQKRMFGFVTFVYPETVKLILAKGNPHFVCDSRVLVKPYKEKSKLPDKKQHQQQLERGEFSCSSPSGHDCRDPYSEFQLGGRMLYSSTQEMLLRKKLEEQADLQQAIELQGRRLMNLQLLDLKNQQHQHNASAVGSPIPSPSFAQAMSALSGSNGSNQDGSEESNNSSGIEAAEEQMGEGVNAAAVSDNNGNGNGNGNVQSSGEDRPKTEESELAESGLEHILPDNLFASPKKSASFEQLRSSLFLTELDSGGGGANAMPASSSTASSDSSMPVSSPLSLAPHKSCFYELPPRLSPGHGALGM